MAERRNNPQSSPTPDTEYDSRLYQVGVLWSGTSRRTGNRIMTGELSLGLLGPRDVLVTENNRPEKGENAPSHLIFIRVPLRGNGAGNGNSRQSDDGLTF
jgi:hypothetical protein